VPLGEEPRPVSVGTMTLFAADGAGGGKPPSPVTGGAAVRGGGVEDAEQATASRANKPRAPRKQAVPSREVIRAV
jgi:hypothetical protein